MVSSTEKARENRLRRAAERQGLMLQKSARRDPRATDYGRWWVYSLSGTLRAGGKRGMTLDEVEEYLTRD